MNKKKISRFILLMVALLAFSGVCTQAADVVKVKLNGTQLNFDVPPQIINERTMVPISQTITALTGQIPAWEPVTKTVTFSYNGNQYKLIIGDAAIYVNGNPIAFDTKVMIVDSRTLVPVRMLAEGIGIKTDFIPETKEVILTTGAVDTTSPRINSVNPAQSNNVSVREGTDVQITVYANKQTTRIKIIDEKDSTRSVIVDKYESGANENIFKASWRPSSGLGVRQPLIYAGNNSNFQSDYAKAYFTVAAQSVTISDAYPVQNSVSYGSSTQAKVLTSDNATKVWLVVSGDTVATSTSDYTTSNSTRTWTISWRPQFTGTKTVTAYAQDSSGNQTTRTFSLTVNDDASPSISSVTAVPSSAKTGDSIYFECQTNTSVTSVSYTIPGEYINGEMTLNNTSGSTKTWRTKALYFDYEGTYTLTATAYSSSGKSTSKSGSVKIQNSSQTVKIKSAKWSQSSAYAGDTVQLTVTSTTGINDIELTTNIGEFYENSPVLVNNELLWVFEVYIDPYQMSSGGRVTGTLYGDAGASYSIPSLTVYDNGDVDY